MAFKKGDRVRLNAEGRANITYKRYKEEVLTVKSGPEGSGRGGNYYFEDTGDLVILGDYLELMPTFHVGDEVKLPKYEGWEFPHYEGQIATITAVGENLRCKWDDGNYSVLTVVGPACLGAYIVEGATLTVGDRVKILAHKDFSTSGNGNWMGEKSVGQLGVVVRWNTKGDGQLQYTVEDRLVNPLEYFGMYIRSELELLDGEPDDCKPEEAKKEEEKPMAETKYRKGDVYEFTSDDCADYHKGDRVVIEQDGDYPRYEKCTGHENSLKLISKQGDNTMAETINVAAAIKNAALTENQRLLRKHGLVDACGNITGAGQDAIWALLAADKEDELVAAIKAEQKALAAEDKKSK